MPRKKNSRALQAEETKQRIFSAAHHLFREKGFDNVTVDEIAKACGFSVGAFYHHFRGKREIMALWHERLDECYKRHYEKMKNAPDFSQKETVEVIREMMLYINETCIKEGLDFTRVLYCYIISNEDFGNEMMSLDRTYFRILRELTERGLGRKEIRKDLASQGPDWVEKRPLPQASAQGGGPGKDKGHTCAIICLLHSQALFEYFLSKGKEQRRVAAIVKSLPRPFPFFLYPAASTSRVRYFADTAEIRCPHPSMAARPLAGACTAPARWRKATAEVPGGAQH